jgi:hypothetical protein
MTERFFANSLSLFGPARTNGVTRVGIDVGFVARLWTYFFRNDACGRCRNILAGMIASDLTIEATWETRSLTKPYRDLLRMPLIPLFDHALALGFVAWKWTTQSDSSGQNQAVPCILCPTSGVFFAYFRRDVFLGMNFLTPGENSTEWNVYDVAVLEPYAPEITGMIKSPLANMLSRMFLCASVQNSEVEAQRTCARPPLVTEQPNDAFLKGSATEEFAENGGTTLERAEQDASAVEQQQRTREVTAQASMAASGGSTTSAPGGTLCVPDEFTGRWPSAWQRGPFFENKEHLAAGKKLARQEMPKSIVDSEKWRMSAEGDICTMFGVSITLLHPDSASSRYKTSIDDATKITRSMSLANISWAARLLEIILNKMFQNTDSARIALEAIEAARAAGAMPSKIAEGAAKAISRRNRYRIKVSFGDTATGEDLTRLYHDAAMSLKSYKLLESKHLNMDIEMLDGDGLPTVAATVSTAPAPAPSAATRS